MKKERKRLPSPQYYIEEFSEEDLPYEDSLAYDSNGSNGKHPNLDQRLVVSSSKSFGLKYENQALESLDALQLSFNFNKSIPLNDVSIELIQKYLNPAGKILLREETGLTSKKQREISKIIRRARANGLIAHIF